MIDTASLRRLAQAAQVQPGGWDWPNDEPIDAYIHALSPAVLLALLDEVEKKEMALRGCAQLACDGDEVEQTVKGFMGLLHQIANCASNALTRPEGA